jgi:hypothetical protein
VRIDQARQEQGTAEMHLAPGLPLPGQFRFGSQSAYDAVCDGNGAVRKGLERAILRPAEDKGGVKQKIAGTWHTRSPNLQKIFVSSSG